MQHSVYMQRRVYMYPCRHVYMPHSVYMQPRLIEHSDAVLMCSYVYMKRKGKIATAKRKAPYINDTPTCSHRHGSAAWTRATDIRVRWLQRVGVVEALERGLVGLSTMLLGTLTPFLLFSTTARPAPPPPRSALPLSCTPGVDNWTTTIRLWSAWLFTWWKLEAWPCACCVCPEAWTWHQHADQLQLSKHGRSQYQGSIKPVDIPVLSRDLGSVNMGRSSWDRMHKDSTRATTYWAEVPELIGEKPSWKISSYLLPGTSTSCH
eukprot:1160703-Pelagomonas_calceolata.AAC.16